MELVTARQRYRGVMTALPRAACIMPTIRGAWQIGWILSNRQAERLRRYSPLCYVAPILPAQPPLKVRYHALTAFPSAHPTPNESRINTDELVDIREVSVDKNLPKEERIAAFIRQIKNPYRFRCGDFVINACFAGNGVTLEECLQGILR